MNQLIFFNYYYYFVVTDIMPQMLLTELELVWIFLNLQWTMSVFFCFYLSDITPF